MGLVPLFDPDHILSEAMWHGLAADQNLLSDAAGILLKPALLKVLAGDVAWTLDPEAKVRLIQQMTKLTFASNGNAVISYPEVRRVLMSVND